MIVKLGRALKKGEHRVKLYHLQPNEIEVNYSSASVKRRFTFVLIDKITTISYFEKVMLKYISLF